MKTTTKSLIMVGLDEPLQHPVFGRLTLRICGMTKKDCDHGLAPLLVRMPAVDWFLTDSKSDDMGVTAFTKQTECSFQGLNNLNAKRREMSFNASPERAWRTARHGERTRKAKARRRAQIRKQERTTTEQSYWCSQRSCEHNTRRSLD